MMYRKPSDSPWGLVVRCDTLCPGVYSVSTAGHGGIMVQIDAARRLLSPEAQTVGFQAGGYLNFEEDCDAPVVLRELMDSGIIAPRTDNYFRPGEYEACIARSLPHWNPAHSQARQDRLSVREATAAKERERNWPM